MNTILFLAQINPEDAKNVTSMVHTATIMFFIFILFDLAIAIVAIILIVKLIKHLKNKNNS